MKSLNTISCGKILFQLLLVTVSSILLMLIMMGFNSHHFLVDDNLDQFYPIIKKSFDQFFETGRFPVYDFFQQRGMIIADEGYYGQTNFLLFISYLLGKCLCVSDCINIYAILCIAIGNAGLLCLFKKMGISLYSSLSAIGMITASSGFFNYGYWYYVFNNYIVLPYLLLSIYILARDEGFLSYIFSGIVLAFSCTLGNLQYSLFHYMLFAVVSISYIIIFGNYVKIKCIASNLILALFLSSPILMIAVKASERRADVVNGLFFSLPVEPSLQLILSVIPYPLFRKFVPEYAPNGQMEGFSFLYTGFFLPCLIFFVLWLFYIVFSTSLRRSFEQAKCKFKAMPSACILFCLVLGFFILLLTKSARLTLLEFFFLCLIFVAYDGLKNGDTNALPSENINVKFLVASIFGIIFFALFEAGKGFLIADIISHIPVVKQFRYLFKVSFVVPFLMVLLGAYVLDIVKFRIKYAVAVFFIIIGVYNNWYAQKGNHLFYNEYNQSSSRKIFTYDNLRKEVDDNGVNLNDYRILPFISSTFTNVWIDYGDTKMLASNLSTLFGCYSLGGYEQASIGKGYAASDKLLIDDDFHYRRQASVPCQWFFSNCKNSSQYALDATVQMQKGAVKYCLFSSDSPFIDDFKNFITSNKILFIIREIPLSNDTVLFELGGNIATLFDGCNLVSKDKLDCIEFVCKKTGSVTSSFLYDPKLRAWSMKDGRRHEYQVSSNECGNAVVNVDWISDDGVVCFQYVNKKKTFVLLEGFLYSAVALMFIFFVCIHSCNVNMKASRFYPFQPN